MQRENYMEYKLSEYKEPYDNVSKRKHLCIINISAYPETLEKSPLSWKDDSVLVQKSFRKTTYRICA